MYLTHFNEMCLVKREIANVMDRHVLIAEIRKRPALWDFQNGSKKSRLNVPDMWKDIAQIVGSDVEKCKRKWKNLRDAYRAEVRRIEHRIESDIIQGCYNSKTDYSSRWCFFEPMSFINNFNKRPRRSIENENSSNNNSNDCQDDDESMYDQYHSICDIKLEPEHTTKDDDIISLEDDYYNDSSNNGYDDHHNNEVDNNRIDNNESPNFVLPTQQPENYPPPKIYIKNFADHQQKQQERSVKENEINKLSTSKSDNCKKCSQRSDVQVHFLEKLEKEEQRLITSTRQDLTHSNRMDHIGDSDYNFLVSFLPQMKKMSELQNLQFRAKMSAMILDVLSPSITANNNLLVPRCSNTNT